VGAGYVGTFSLGPVTQGSGTGSLAWHFTVDNSDIQFLSQGQSLTQAYTVIVTDGEGGSAAQEVTITLNGTNDAPTGAPQTIVTDAGANGFFAIPGWALALNGMDPDVADTLSFASASAGSGGTADSFGANAFFTDDATLGGSFGYRVTDGFVESAQASATVVNHATSTTTLTGTAGDDIIIAKQGSEALDGGDGNDVLIGNAGPHLLTGGSGDDIFAFVTITDAATIADFDNAAEGDSIAISAAAFGAGLTSGMDASGIFETSADGEFQSSDSRFHYDTGSNTLYFSADGTTASATVVATFQTGVTLLPQDLHIV
jgi:VCBS repeat-containing protein